MKIQVNHVLVLPDDEFTGKDGIALSRDFDPMQHVAITGTVLQVGERLFSNKLFELCARGPQDHLSQFTHFSSLASELSLPWLPDDNVEAGDRVMFNYVNHLVSAEEFGLTLEGKSLLLVPYYQLYAKLDPVEPLNGYVLIEPDVRRSKGFFTEAKKLASGIVKFSGKPYLKRISLTPQSEYHPKIGERVFFKNHAPEIEWKFYQGLNPGGRPLVRSQQHEILAVVE